jgi:hypothetical protein
MQLNPVGLGSGQGGWLVTDRVRHRGAPQIVHQSGATCPRHLCRGQPGPLAGTGGESGDLARVPRREGGLQVGEVGRDLQGAVQVLAAEPVAGLGLAGQDRIPGIERVQPAEEPGCGRQEFRDQAGIVARPERSRISAIASAGERSLASASASWVRYTIRIASGIGSPFTR